MSPRKFEDGRYLPPFTSMPHADFRKASARSRDKSNCNCRVKACKASGPMVGRSPAAPSPAQNDAIAEDCMHCARASPGLACTFLSRCLIVVMISSSLALSCTCDFWKTNSAFSKIRVCEVGCGPATLESRAGGLGVVVGEVRPTLVRPSVFRSRAFCSASDNASCALFSASSLTPTHVASSSAAFSAETSPMQVASVRRRSTSHFSSKCVKACEALSTASPATHAASAARIADRSRSMSSAS
mmetsp:Transcript_106465/g.306032  ORF Transcript_106465/g.306032 Transcript_106465/m.306032 type:complete len:243 (-) Transcript_106465:138-866(-)